MFDIKKQWVQFEGNWFESNQGDQIVMNNKKSRVEHIFSKVRCPVKLVSTLFALPNL